MKNLFNRFRKDEEGATLVEYGIALGIAIAVGSAGLVALSGNIEANMASAGGALTDARTTP
ncbi:MAG: Flp family type IVb pilin [Sulfitobacter sp.]